MSTRSRERIYGGSITASAERAKAARQVADRLACKAARLDWRTAATIVKNRPGVPPVPAGEMEKAKEVFESVSVSAAQRTVRF